MGRTSIEKRIWSKVTVSAPGDCWLWKGATDRKGYGQLRSRQGPGGMQYAHRLVFQLRVGAIPAGLCVLHRCDQPACVNPAHLVAGTLRDNSRDMISKGRGKGHFPKKTHCKHGHALTEQNSYRWNGHRFCRACRKRISSEANARATATRRARNG